MNRPREFWIDIEALNFDWRVRVIEQSSFPVSPNCLNVIEKAPIMEQMQRLVEALELCHRRMKYTAWSEEDCFEKAVETLDEHRKWLATLCSKESGGGCE